MKNKNVLTGKDWKKYLKMNGLMSMGQMELYSCTWNYTPIYHIGDYYFAFGMYRGYKNLSALKRLV